MHDSITKILKKAADNIYNVSIDKDIIFKIEQIVDLCIKAYENNQRILFCGNGGSASDAQHIAAELSGRFLKDRKPLFAEALHVNSSYLTAVSNDYGFENWISKAIEFYSDPEDLIILISSSGKSLNMINAADTAKGLGIKNIVTFTGFLKDNPLSNKGNINFWVNSDKYNFIEMVHHIWLLAIVDNIAKIKI